MNSVCLNLGLGNFLYTHPLPYASHLSGVIREIAEVKCGGASRLENAISRGAAVVAHNSRGQELICFPELSAGVKQSSSSSQRISKSKASSLAAWDLIDESFQTLTYKITAKQSALDGSEGDQKQAEAWAEIESKVGTTISELNKALAKVDQILGRASEVPYEMRSDLCDNSIVRLQNVTEKGHLLAGDLAFMLRFKKLRGGEAVTISGAKALQSDAAKTLGDMIELAKVLKSMLAPNK